MVFVLCRFLYARVLCTAWLFNTYDPQEDMWFFNQRGCTLVLVLNIILLVWFIVSVNHTKNKFLRKRAFYHK